MKSIMHDKKDRTCYLCMLLHDDDSRKAVLQEHHVFGGTANRKLSEKHGLKVYLCIDHHLTGSEAVHMNAKTAILLKLEGQRAFEKRYPNMDFMKIFGKNYLNDEPRQQVLQEPAAAAGQGVQEVEGVSGMDTEAEFKKMKLDCGTCLCKTCENRDCVDALCTGEDRTPLCYTGMCGIYRNKQNIADV